MSERIVLDYEMDRLKIITLVKLKTRSGKFIPYNTVVDTGSSDTALSRQLFSRMGFEAQGKIKTTITGVNATSEGFSTIIDHFVLGGVDLGKTRVTVSDLSPNLENTIILGMNILAWFHMFINHSQKEIVLIERKIKDLNKTTRFYRTDIFTHNILNAMTEYEK